MKSTLLLPAVAGAILSMSAPSFAETAVAAATDLNVRAGPGPQYPVVGVLAAGQSAVLRGCLANSKWCTIAEAGGEGWVYSDYLVGDFGGQKVVLSARPADSAVTVVEAPKRGGGDTGAVLGGVTGAIAGAVIGGPVGAAVGGAGGVIAGGTAGTVIDPPGQVRTYVQANQTEPVYLDGEVVVGAGLPETVQLAEIPDYEYRYVYLNGQPVLVEPTSRRIVYVMR